VVCALRRVGAARRRRRVTIFAVDAPWTAHIVGMSNHIEATVRELDFVQGTSDKFYRVFTLGTTMVVQYGRNGTFGSISSKEFDDAAAATKAADKQVAAKMAKGYQPVRSGALSFDHDPTDNELDTAANLMPRGESTVAMPAQSEPSAVVTAANSAPPTTRTQPPSLGCSPPSTLPTLRPSRWTPTTRRASPCWPGWPPPPRSTG